MTKTVTATYGSEETVRNVLDDLISVGIARETIYAGEGGKVKVIAPDTTVREILEILERHQPSRVDWP